MTDSSNDTSKAAKPAGKGKATPSRKQAQAANVRPLVSDRTAEGKAQAREKAKEERAKMRAGQLAGDDRYLPVRERGPQKKFVRDLIDNRYTVGEFLVPAMVLVLLLSFMDPNQASTFNKILSLSSLGIMGAIVIDSLFISRKIKRATKEKFGDKTEAGLVFYGIVRASQLRMMRIPRATVGPFLKK